jgi:multicomponent Na+:H+ antiporter subunit B
VRFGSPILDTAVQLLVPFILLFALYVVFHGHYSPGGGFQGGAMIAAAVIVVRLVRGRDATWGLSRSAADLVGVAGVAAFAGVGALCMVAGGRYLDYAALPFDVSADHLSHVRGYGILAVELGVTLGVAGVLISIARTLSEDAPDEEGSRD